MEQTILKRLKPEKLHVTLHNDVSPAFPLFPRFYTLTHSDRTGDMFLTIGRKYDLKQIAGWYTQFMRDEVLAEWQTIQGEQSLRVYLHVSGGFVFGTAGIRERILKRVLPLVLETFRYGDRQLFLEYPHLDYTSIFVHFRYGNNNDQKIEHWGMLKDYT
jgi:hypothetical protein